MLFLLKCYKKQGKKKFRYYPDYRSFSPKHIKRQCRATIVSSYDSSDDKVCLLIFLLVWDQQSGTVRFKLREGGINVKGRRKDWMDGAEMCIAGFFYNHTTKVSIQVHIYIISKEILSKKWISISSMKNTLILSKRRWILFGL